MGDVLTFATRPRPAGPETVATMPPAEKRARLEEALQTALDAADHIIAVLDQWDGDADLEPDADAEPSLAAPENQMGSQIGAMRGGDDDREGGAPEIALPEVVVAEVVAAEAAGEIEIPPLRWGGRGNCVAAAGVVLLDLSFGAKEFGSG